MSIATLPLPGEFIRTRDEYLSNFPDAYAREEFRKASELLWGAITQTIKFVGAVNGKEIRKHGEFFDFVKSLSNSYKDPDLYSDFLLLDKLHKNFYDPEIPASDMYIYVEKTFKFIEKMEKIVSGSQSTVNE